MGTIGILRLLLRNWSAHSPIYKNEERHVATLSTRQLIRHVIQRIWKPIGVVISVVLVIATVQFLCGTQSQSVGLASLCAAGGIDVFLIGIALIAYLWPAFIAVSASRVIAVEREHQTWDILLTTPYDWRDLVMAKLAAALHGFNAFSGAFFYMQIFLVAVIVALVLGQSQSLIGSNGAVTPTVALLMIIVALTEFVIARAQDYVLAALIGLLSSLLVPTRQSAATFALMGALAMILIRALITALFIAMLPAMTVPTLLLLLPIGPSSAVVFALALPLAIVFLVALVLAREGAIRLIFRWLLVHLADGEPFDTATAAS